MLYTVIEMQIFASGVNEQPCLTRRMQVSGDVNAMLQGETMVGASGFYILAVEKIISDTQAVIVGIGFQGPPITPGAFTGDVSGAVINVDDEGDAESTRVGKYASVLNEVADNTTAAGTNPPLLVGAGGDKGLDPTSIVPAQREYSIAMRGSGELVCRAELGTMYTVRVLS